MERKVAEDAAWALPRSRVVKTVPEDALLRQAEEWAREHLLLECPPARVQLAILASRKVARLGQCAVGAFRIDPAVVVVVIAKQFCLGEKATDSSCVGEASTVHSGYREDRIGVDGGHFGRLLVLISAGALH